MGQTGPTLVGTGYSRPVNGVAATGVAPGQIVRFQVTGLKTVLIQPGSDYAVEKATSLPLPSTIARISVTAQQYIQRFTADEPTPLNPQAVPMVSVEQIDLCPGLIGTPIKPSTSDCIVTYITAQIPYELNYNVVANPYWASYIIISENGAISERFGIAAIPDNIHVVTACDTSAVARSRCQHVVTHADGSPVSADSPAVAGETVIVYAWGLGYTSPGVRSGDATPSTSAIPTLNNISARFVFSPNAAASRVFGDPETPQFPEPAFLTGGQVGLYQIHVQLPLVIPPVVPCSAPLVESNLTINLTGFWSTDGAAICVEPPH